MNEICEVNKISIFDWKIESFARIKVSQGKGKFSYQFV